MKWSPKNLKEAMIPILLLNWLTGLGAVEYPVGNSRRKMSFIFILITIFSFWFANVVFELGSCSTADAHVLDVMVFTMLRYFNTLTASVSLIIGWFCRQKMQLCTERIKLMDETLESLGLAKNYNKTLKNSLFMATIWLILIFNVYIADVYLHLSEMKIIKSMYCVFCFQWPIHTNTVVDITFISALSFIGSRFKKINCMLQGNSRGPQSWLFGRLKKSNITSNLVMPPNSGPLMTKRDLVEIIKHLHLELCKATKVINKIYEVQIAMEMATNLVSVTAFLFYFRNAFLIPVSRIEIKIKNIMALTLWGTIYFLRFLHINVASERICAEAHKTGNIVLDLKQLKKNTELAEQMEQFTLQLIHHPLHITMHGFNNLGNSFIVKFLGQVMTYLIILIQLK